MQFSNISTVMQRNSFGVLFNDLPELPTILHSFLPVLQVIT